VPNVCIVRSKRNESSGSSYHSSPTASQSVTEAIVAYKKASTSLGYTKHTLNVWPVTLSYSNFKVILDAHTLTMAEWASLLQVSERTFHRYAKEDLSFNSILNERIQILNTLLIELQAVAGSDVKAWLYSTPPAFGGARPFDYLFTLSGITKVRQVLHSIQHGIVA
jgi:uncharacterized protein (DUF2384 family)